MDKVAKGPDYNIHTQPNKQTKNHEICESRITGQTTNYNNNQTYSEKKKLKQKFKAEKRNGNNLLYL